MMKARLDQLFALEPPDKSAADSTQLRLPTLEERVKLYLRAVYGEREVTREEYLRAHNLIVDAMAAHIAAKSKINPSDEIREPSKPTPDDVHIPEPFVIHASRQPVTLRARSLASRSILLFVALVTGGMAAWLAVHMRAPVSTVAVMAVPQVSVGYIPQPNPEEIAALLKGGQELIATGKIPEARAALKIAAEAGSAPAALALGGTYDPTILQARQSVIVVETVPALTPRAQTQRGPPMTDPVADIAMARAWYEKARDLGSAEAAVRLEQLADHASRQGR